jgi:argininosuccinate lyase
MKKDRAPKASKLWQSGGTTLHPLVEEYTVGTDYLTDRMLLPYDLQASKAHAQMLKRMGVLSAQELRDIEKGLAEIQTLWAKDAFSITRAQEDGHTAIEQYLTEHYGEAGKKIHTGRSRNDQSLVMTRLFMKEKIAHIDAQAKTLSHVFKRKASSTKSPMPGYTHLQKAMPTSVATWLSLFADALIDTRTLLTAARAVIDQNPLGSASGFGIGSFPLDRAFTTKTLGFAKTQENPLYCGMSRGYFETIALAPLGNIMFIAGRFASDMLLFTMQEFGFFSLPPSFTTGSSIMPQKRNYDLFEIMRGNVKVFRGYEQQIRQIIEGMNSNYHRDLQLTKQPFVDAITMCEKTLALLIEVVPQIEIHTDALDKSMTPDIFATDEVYKLVKKGATFRDAYRTVKENIYGSR